jgi:hypothetical protein
MWILIGVLGLAVIVVGFYVIYEYDKPGYAIAAFSVGTALLGYAFYKESKEWDEYKEVHHCEETGRTETDFMIICNSNGKSTFCYPVPITKHEFACDDGFLWR